jgi:type II secretion system protein G
MEHTLTPDSERGFTLVELMVVVAIIALLAAIIIPNYIHARAEAAASGSQATMNQIATALEEYHNDQLAYPTTSGSVDPALFGGTNNQYLTSTPSNSLNHGAYAYKYEAGTGGKPDTYTLTDNGPYDPATLTSLPNGPGSKTRCSTDCTKIVYDPQNGLYGAN